jgi:hypothetical protein
MEIGGDMQITERESIVKLLEEMIVELEQKKESEEEIEEKEFDPYKDFLTFSLFLEKYPIFSQSTLNHWLDFFDYSRHIIQPYQFFKKILNCNVKINLKKRIIENDFFGMEKLKEEYLNPSHTEHNPHTDYILIEDFKRIYKKIKPTTVRSIIYKLLRSDSKEDFFFINDFGLYLINPYLFFKWVKENKEKSPSLYKVLKDNNFFGM